MDWLMEWIHTFWTSLHAGQFPQLGIWSYLILAIFVAIEGPIATLLGAAAASAGFMRPGWVFVSAAIGNLTADSLWYSLGSAGQLDWLLRYGRRFGVRKRHLERLTDEMHNHAAKILIVAKLTAGFIIPSLIAAGLAKVPWKRWFPVIFSGEMIWTGTLVLIGYYATEAIKQIERGVEYVGIAASAFFLLFILWGVRRIWRKRNEKQETSTE
jgi:membrane protein DedA with SNARE-associated domain